jgi:rhamnogalacturonyl hydrolase YesR
VRDGIHQYILKEYCIKVTVAQLHITATLVWVCAASKDLEAKGYDRACQLRWCWADALFMAPPAWTALSNVTGDPKYLNYSDREYWATHAELYQMVESGGGLFLRDSRFSTQKDDNGNLIFWSRGNGWVFSGLPAIIDRLPSDYPSRPKCVSSKLHFQKL